MMLLGDKDSIGASLEGVNKRCDRLRINVGTSLVVASLPEAMN